MNRLFFFFGCIILIISCSKCKDPECTDSTNPDCPNYVEVVEDPCAGSSEVSANFYFEMRSSLSGLQPEVWVTDTICLAGQNSTVRVRVLQENPTFIKWIVGATEYSSTEVQFTVSEDFIDQELPVTLIVHAPVDSICFPEDNGMDTITKYFKVREKCYADVFGTYRGSLQTAPLDSFDLRIAPYGCIDNISGMVYLVNFDQQQDSCSYFDIYQWSNRIFEFHTNNSACSSARGKAELSSDLSQISIRYQILSPDNPLQPSLWPYLNFAGRKIN
jgi:hypothetical protein